MTIHSGSGDDGTTSLGDGRRVPKYHVRVEAYGSVDELISWIGLLRDLKENKDRQSTLIYIQDQLMDSVSAMASGSEESGAVKTKPDDNCVSFLEAEILKMESGLLPLRKFVLPGGNISISYCHIARCVCRRAERAVCRLNDSEKSPEIVRKFLNRLSDYLFVLARVMSFELDSKEITWPL
jgi:cob(I)alamin adenosyltransferase